MLGNTTFNGKHYGVPLTMNIVGLFANMDLLKQVGYTEVPGTYDDFIACCDKLIAKGIIPFGCAGKETWCVTEYLESVIEKSCGAKTLDDIFMGRASWNNKDVAKAVDTFQAMVTNGYFDPNGMALSNDEVKANFMAGKYAFYMNGTWNCADFANNAEFFPKVKVAEFPVIDSSKAKLGQLIGGPSDTLAVAKNSKNAAVAWTPFYDTSSVNGLTREVQKIVANADQMVLFGDTAMSADVAQIYLSYVAKVYGKEVNGSEFIAGLSSEIK